MPSKAKPGSGKDIVTGDFVPASYDDFGH